MRNYLTFILMFIAISLSAQQEVHKVPSNIRQIMNSLEGRFTWKIIRPSENRILRTGTKISQYDLDSLILVGHETFDSSSIKQVGLFGYNDVDSSFFTIGLYNVSLDPKVRKGVFDEKSRQIVFHENESSKFFLNLDSDSRYYWTYEFLEGEAWKKRDLEIIFERVIQ